MINLSAAPSIEPRSLSKPSGSPVSNPTEGANNAFAALFQDAGLAGFPKPTITLTGSTGPATGNELPVDGGSVLPEAALDAAPGDPAAMGFVIAPDAGIALTASIASVAASGNDGGSGPADLPLPLPASMVRSGIAIAPETATDLTAKAQQTAPENAMLNGKMVIPTEASPAKAGASPSAAAASTQPPAAPGAPIAAAAVVPGVIPPAMEQPAAALVPVADILRAKVSGEGAKADGEAPAPDDGEPRLVLSGSEPAQEKRAKQDVVTPMRTLAAGTDAQGAQQTQSQPTLFSSMTATTAPGAANLSGAAPTQAAALDLNNVIDRLIEARQSAGAGRIHLSVAHDDFGAVGIRLDRTAGAGMLGVALSSADPGLAPAVQAALAERFAAERGQTDRQPTAGEQASRQDTGSSRSEGGAQNGQQASHSHTSQDQSRSAPGRQTGEQTSRPSAETAEQGDDEPGRSDARGRYA